MDALPARSLLIAAGATAVFCLCALWALRSGPAVAFRGPSRSDRLGKRRRRKSCGCGCSCCGGGGAEVALPNGEPAAGARKAVVEERQVSAGGSMMEEMVPEITTHALSYLDYTSLCRLSMTNSAMRRAANDDGAWKALYHKDFTLEQEGITPSNGWKAYYAATKAIISVNSEFYSIIRERMLSAMRHFWLNADYVKCVHASGELFAGYHSVMDSWAVAFNWGQAGDQGISFQIRDVRARVLSEMAWVTMKAFVDMDSGPFHVTNIYEFHNGRWYMVYHHSSIMMMDGIPPGHILLG